MEANLTALRLARKLEREQRPARDEEQRLLAAWSGWGAVPQLFDEDRPEWAAVRAQLRELAGEGGYEAARRTTINAHYTDPRIAAAIWHAVQQLGFDRGRVLEPGCGAGIFLGLAPVGADLVGVELDPSTARIARALYPHAEIRAESFAATRLPDGYFASHRHADVAGQRASVRAFSEATSGVYFRELILSPLRFQVSTTVNECRSGTSSGGVMFTLSTTVNDVSLESDRPPAALFLPRRLDSSPRRLHVNDSNSQWWPVVYTRGGLIKGIL